MEDLEKELRQLFQNRFNCYADTEDESVVLAMDENQFTKVAQEILASALKKATDKALKRKYPITGNQHQVSFNEGICEAVEDINSLIPK